VEKEREEERMRGVEGARGRGEEEEKQLWQDLQDLSLVSCFKSSN
jgi:hypothetical protein